MTFKTSSLGLLRSTRGREATVSRKLELQRPHQWERQQQRPARWQLPDEGLPAAVAGGGPHGPWHLPLLVVSCPGPAQAPSTWGSVLPPLPAPRLGPHGQLPAPRFLAVPTHVCRALHPGSPLTSGTTKTLWASHPSTTRQQAPSTAGQMRPLGAPAWPPPPPAPAMKSWQRSCRTWRTAWPAPHCLAPAPLFG